MSTIMDCPRLGSVTSSVLSSSGSGEAAGGSEDMAEDMAVGGAVGGAGVELTKLCRGREDCDGWAGLSLLGEGSTAALTKFWIRELLLQKEASLAAVSNILKTSSSALSFSCLEAATLSLSQKLFSTESDRLYLGVSFRVFGGDCMLTFLVFLPVEELTRAELTFRESRGVF